MTTLEQRELASISPVIEQSIPTDYNAGKKKDKSHELALDQKAIRLLDGTNEITPYTHELTDTLGNPRDIVMKQLQEGNYTTEKKAPYGPYKHAV